MTLLNLTDPTVRPDDSGHGPECPMGSGRYPWYWAQDKGSWRRRNGQGISSCECVMCHCGPDFAPGGFLGSCARCHRPLVRDGQVVR